MAKARKKRSSRDAISAAKATLCEHAGRGVVITLELDPLTQKVVPTPFWISRDAAVDGPMLMEVARIYEKNPEAFS
jgi:hypothetical protein